MLKIIFLLFILVITISILFFYQESGSTIRHSPRSTIRHSQSDSSKRETRPVDKKETVSATQRVDSSNRRNNLRRQKPKIPTRNRVYNVDRHCAVDRNCERICESLAEHIFYDKLQKASNYKKKIVSEKIATGGVYKRNEYLSHKGVYITKDDCPQVFDLEIEKDNLLLAEKNEVNNFFSSISKSATQINETGEYWTKRLSAILQTITPLFPEESQDYIRNVAETIAEGEENYHLCLPDTGILEVAQLIHRKRKLLVQIQNEQEQLLDYAIQYAPGNNEATRYFFMMRSSVSSFYEIELDSGGFIRINPGEYPEYDALTKDLHEAIINYSEYLKQEETMTPE